MKELSTDCYLTKTQAIYSDADGFSTPLASNLLIVKGLQKKKALNGNISSFGNPGGLSEPNHSIGW